MRRNGTTSSGRQRWRCGGCGSSSVRKIDSRAKRLGLFLRWLLSKQTQSDMGCSRSTFKMFFTSIKFHNSRNFLSLVAR